MIAAMALTLARYAERPDLRRDTEAISVEVWPEHNLHGDVLNAF